MRIRHICAKTHNIKDLCSFFGAHHHDMNNTGMCTGTNTSLQTNLRTIKHIIARQEATGTSLLHTYAPNLLEIDSFIIIVLTVYHWIEEGPRNAEKSCA